MREAINRPTQMTVDLKAVVHNAREILNWTGAKNLIAVLKADAYGVGSIQVAQALETEKLLYKIAVSNLDEAYELRNAGIDTPIWIFGAHDYSYLNQFTENDFEITVGHLEWLENLPELSHTLKIQLAVDTGMGRIGFQNKVDLNKAVEIIEQNPKLGLSGIYTHFATADSSDSTYFNQQVDTWHDLTDELEIPDELKTLANSPASIWHRDADISLRTIRLGYLLYGFNPSDNLLEMPSGLNLKPALKLTTQISDIRQLKKGQSISYGATYTASADITVATIPIGYADGWRRSEQNANVYIDGKSYPIIGRVTMDYTLIKVDQSIELNQEVILVDNIHGLEQRATENQTIGYEVLTGLSPRIKRIYLGD
ncbi:MAG: alanine racemase [Lactobacillaceae bacterium]|jgi:alanine racemase|nr:alanine racemase [Lactobacillaceae bacterium]